MTPQRQVPGDTVTLLVRACIAAGVDPTGWELIRWGENALFRLPGRVVVRIARPGQQRSARREVVVARWLAAHGVAAVRPLDEIDQPVEIGDRAATFWAELPRHRAGTPAELATALRTLHALPVPAEVLAPLAPFVRLSERIAGAIVLSDDARAWLQSRRDDLEDQYSRGVPPGLPQCMLHGDASGSNLAVTDDGTVTLLDLERCSAGPPEWDLTSFAVELGYRWISDAEYRTFCAAYSHDVTVWPGYPLFRDIRELRMTTWLAQQAGERPELRAEARHRVSCLRGERGSRPWAWSPH